MHSENYSGIDTEISFSFPFRIKIVCVTHIYITLQLVKLCDALAVPIAAGVVYMITDCNCNGLIKEIMNEIGQSDVSETDNRNISMFLENIATSQPDLIIPILDEITDYLSNDVCSLFLFFLFLVSPRFFRC